ncbi:MAG: uroporphyrinogen-III synthase [Casimicrobiaceae bacterium]|nr:uroporphyrinogen-III synthase [Casimicrobiaceae bacterium]MDW8312700.1 uroporphyrinogen-III synthase [Burkholderiales bacterium]
MSSRFDFHLEPSPGAVPPLGPLAGVRVLVTRPALPAARTAARLAALGAEPLVFPTLVIEPPSDPAPLERARARLAEFHAAVFVSPSAVEMTLAPYGARPLAWPCGVTAFAPGPGTAEALAACGVEPVRMPETRFDSEGLLALAELSAASVAGRQVVIFRAETGRDLLPEELARRGATVEVVAAYQSRAPESAPTGLVELLRDGRIDAVSVMSAEALENLVALVPEAERARLRALELYASHPRIAERAQALGFAKVTTTEAGDAGLISALLAQHAA